MVVDIMRDTGRGRADDFQPRILFRRFLFRHCGQLVFSWHDISRAQCKTRSAGSGRSL
jgi:hypothetical protein